MKKSKLIQTRVAHQKFEELSKEADSKDQSVSELIRKKLFGSKVEIERIEDKTSLVDNTNTPVFQRPEFLKTVVWIYSLKDNYSYKSSIDEVILYRSVIDSFIMDLDPKYLDHFYNVKKDLERVIDKYSPFTTIAYYFTKKYNNEYFDFEKFEKMILEDIM